MSELELARLQFGITTVFHFIFVPITIGLSLFVAYCQTRWVRSGDELYLRMTRFWGKLMLISFSVGVATGIVQEFQFGMNWSAYSRYVGDIFGAPLAMEGLAAFFVESTFLGLWLFGWNRLPPKLHAATAWLFSGATALSALFIIAANSWMQHPVGYKINPVRGRAEMTSIFDVLGNSTLWLAFPHVVFAAFMTAGLVVLGVSGWFLVRRLHLPLATRSIQAALPFVIAGTLLTLGFGHFQGTLLEQQQPMKMAAAEALFDTTSGAGLSLFATGDFSSNPGHTNRDLQIPKLLSFIGHLDPNATIKGINQLNAEYRAKYGPGEYAPVIAVTYWTFRAMVGVGTIVLVLALVGWWLARKGRLQTSVWYARALVAIAVLPVIGNATGWIFTEMGRQPWVVYGLLKTAKGVSPAVSSTEVWITLIGFTLLYGVLALVAGRLAGRVIAHGPPDAPQPEPAPGKPDLALVY